MSTRRSQSNSASAGSYRYQGARRRPRKRSRAPLVLSVLGLLLVAGIAGVVAVALWWPAAAIEVDPQALVHMKLAPVGERVESVGVVDDRGRRVPVRLQAGQVTPRGKLAPGLHLEVRVTVRRAGWIGWLVGATKHVSLSLTTPRAHLRSTLLHLAPGAAVALQFDAPVGVAVLTLPGFGTQRITFQKPRDVVQTGLHAAGSNRFGVAKVATAARSWEALSPPVSVSWFPAGTRLEALVKPAPGTTIQPTTKLAAHLLGAGLERARPDAPDPRARLPPAPGRRPRQTRSRLRRAAGGYALGKSLTVGLPAPTDVIAKGRNPDPHEPRLEDPGRLDAAAPAAPERSRLPAARLASGSPATGSRRPPARRRRRSTRRPARSRGATATPLPS